MRVDEQFYQTWQAIIYAFTLMKSIISFLKWVIGKNERKCSLFMKVHWGAKWMHDDNFSINYIILENKYIILCFDELLSPVNILNILKKDKWSWKEREE